MSFAKALCDCVKKSFQSKWNQESILFIMKSDNILVNEVLVKERAAERAMGQELVLVQHVFPVTVLQMPPSAARLLLNH